MWTIDVLLNELEAELGADGLALAKRISEASKSYKNQEVMYRLDLLRVTKTIVNCNVADILFTLPLDVQSGIVKTTLTLRNENAFNAYFKALKLAGYPKVIFTGIGYTTQKDNLFEKFEAGKFNPASIPLQVRININVFNASSSEERLFNQITMYMLHTVYKDSLMLEVLDRLEAESISYSLLDFIALLEDWMNLKNYPLTWTIQMINLAKELK